MLIDVERKSRTRKPSAVSMETRVSFQAIVDGHVNHVKTWIEQTATGIPKVDKNNNLITDGMGALIYEVKPDPATAVKLISDLAEYVLPKLSRSEAVNVNLDAQDLRTLSIDQLLSLKQELLVQSVVTIEQESETPEWLK